MGRSSLEPWVVLLFGSKIEGWPKPASSERERPQGGAVVAAPRILQSVSRPVASPCEQTLSFQHPQSLAATTSLSSEAQLKSFKA